MRKKAAVFAALALIAGTVFATTTASAGAAASGFQISSRLTTGASRCRTSTPATARAC